MGFMSGGVTTTYTIKDLNGSVIARMGVSKPNNSNKKLKRLHYNFKQISAKILRSKTSGNAGQAVISARGKAAELRRKLKCGEYDDEELEAAIAHADQMVRIAKKRQIHLKEEENAKRGGPCLGDIEEEQEREEEEALSGAELDAGSEELDSEELEGSLRELQRLMQEHMQEMMQELETDSAVWELTEELTDMSRVTMDPEDLEEMKKKHRQEELREIMKADMKYLKAVFNKLAREKQEAASSGSSGGSSGMDSGVSLELGGVEMPVQTSGAAPVMIEGGSVDEVV